MACYNWCVLSCDFFLCRRKLLSEPQGLPGTHVLYIPVQTASSCIYTSHVCVGTVPPKPVMPDRVGGFPVDFLRQVV